ncbi:MAG: exodeoxyribonuclease VII large subunit [Mariprofundaceae bacterium]
MLPAPEAISSLGKRSVFTLHLRREDIPSPLSVTELTAGIKKILEQNYANIEVVGEVSRLTKHASGHLYFTVKDAHASISAVIWRSTAMRLRQHPEEGGEFTFSGHLSLYEPQGRYQFIVRSVQASGSGKLAAEFEKQKRIFADRGWFDHDRKRILPKFPTHIAIVTSPTAAAFEDVKKVLATRPAWLQISLSPAVVQGVQAAASIVSAIDSLHALDQRPDLILLVRGGGSMEDLWCFNDERVVRTIVDANIPIITGIGHEIDTTLADLAADLRAATPSIAAECSCPDRDTLRSTLPRLSLLYQLLQHRLTHHKTLVTQQCRQIKHSWQLEQDKRHLHIDRCQTHALQHLQMSIKQRRKVAVQYTQRLMNQEPNNRLRQRQQTLDQYRQRLFISQLYYQEKCYKQHSSIKQRMQWASEKQLTSSKQTAAQLASRISELGPKQVLQRGYALLRNHDGLPISSIKQLQPDHPVGLQLHDGFARMKTVSIKKEPS